MCAVCIRPSSTVGKCQELMNKSQCSHSELFSCTSVWGGAFSSHLELNTTPPLFSQVVDMKRKEKLDTGAGWCCEPRRSLSLCWSIQVKVKWLLPSIAGSGGSLFSMFFTLFAWTEAFPLKSSAKTFGLFHSSTCSPPLLRPPRLLPYHYPAPHTARKVLRRCRMPEKGQRRRTVMIQPGRVGRGFTSVI